MGMKFKKPVMKGFPNLNADFGAGIDFSVLNLQGIEETIHNIVYELPRIVQVRYARATAAIGVDVLSRSLPRTPLDTGELRESSVIKLKLGRSTRIIGRGRADGTVEANFSSLVSDALAHVRQINLDVSFNRMSKKGDFDVAQWTHEALAEYGSDFSPSARTPNTGPKYLEIPWKERENKYRKILRDVVDNKKLASDIALASRVKQSKVGKYEVNVVETIARRIARKGYYGGVL